MAYSTVFIAQGIGMLLAIYCLRQVNIQEFKDNAQAAISAVLANDIDG